MYVTLPLGFSTPLDRCRARAATPLNLKTNIIIHYRFETQFLERINCSDTKMKHAKCTSHERGKPFKIYSKKKKKGADEL